MHAVDYLTSKAKWLESELQSQLAVGCANLRSEIPLFIHTLTVVTSCTTW